jgi:hypothetical protein
LSLFKAFTSMQPDAANPASVDQAGSFGLMRKFRSFDRTSWKIFRSTFGNMGPFGAASALGGEALEKVGGTYIVDP